MIAMDRMTRTRTRLLLDQPWFGSLSMRLKIVEDAQTATMATDGSELRYNPEFVTKQTDEHLTAILAHEVMHCALLHPFRRGSRDSEQWNKACDYAVNSDLVAAGFRLPSDALLDSKYAGLSADVIYAQLGDTPKPQDSQGGKQPDQTPLSTGTVQDAPNGSNGQQPGTDPAGQPQPGMSEEDWKIATEQATSVSRAAGKLPGSAVDSSKAVRNSPEDWRAILREFIEHTQPSDYSWGVPNRRHIADGLYLPGIVKENLGVLAIAIDTSGSISQRILDSFASEVTAIAQEARPERVTVLYCDTSIRHTEEFTPDDAEITLKCHGRGGTRFAPVLDALNAWDVPPAACLYFTDLENGSEQIEQPAYPMLWVTGKNVTRRPPFGDVVRVDGF